MVKFIKSTYAYLLTAALTRSLISRAEAIPIYAVRAPADRPYIKWANQYITGVKDE